MDQQRAIPPGLPGRFFSHAVPDPDTRAEIGHRFRAGEPLSVLAAAYGISERTVRRYAEGGE